MVGKDVGSTSRLPFVPNPFARSLTAHMRARRKRHDGSSHPMFANWSDGIHPQFRDEAASVPGPHRLILVSATREHHSALTATGAGLINSYDEGGLDFLWDEKEKLGLPQARDTRVERVDGYVGRHGLTAPEVQV
jgi:hypothetical protein